MRYKGYKLLRVCTRACITPIYYYIYNIYNYITISCFLVASSPQTLMFTGFEVATRLGTSDTSAFLVPNFVNKMYQV